MRNSSLGRDGCGPGRSAELPRCAALQVLRGGTGSWDGSLQQSHLGNTKFLLSGPENLILVLLLHAGTQPSPERSIPGFSSPSVTNPGAVSLHHPGLDTDSTPWSQRWLHWGTGEQPGLR